MMARIMAGCWPNGQDAGQDDSQKAGWWSWAPPTYWDDFYTVILPARMMTEYHHGLHVQACIYIYIYIERERERERERDVYTSSGHLFVFR